MEWFECLQRVVILYRKGEKHVACSLFPCRAKWVSGASRDSKFCTITSASFPSEAHVDHRPVSENIKAIDSKKHSYKKLVVGKKKNWLSVLAENRTSLRETSERKIFINKQKKNIIIELYWTFGGCFCICVYGVAKGKTKTFCVNDRLQAGQNLDKKYNWIAFKMCCFFFSFVGQHVSRMQKSTVLWLPRTSIYA